MFLCNTVSIFWRKVSYYLFSRLKDIPKTFLNAIVGIAAPILPLIIAGGVVLIILAVWFMSRLKRSWRRSSPRYAKPFCDPCFCW